MGVLQKIFGKKKFDNSGYLLPEHWKCIICTGGHRKKTKATYAVRPLVFLIALKDDESFPELVTNDKSVMREYTEYISHPQSGFMKQPAGTEHLEDTSGLARDRTGMGFDAVFLCASHLEEMNKAIETSGKRNKSK